MHRRAKEQAFQHVQHAVALDSPELIRTWADWGG